MKKITLLILLILTASMVGFAQKDTSDLKTAISSNFPDNVAGFITPARLRAVSEDIMRSNANLLERNVFSEPLVVNDSVKADGFYRWTGSAWASVSDDTTAWARSGGFILPLNYGDKLSIDTGRVEGLLYPTGNVNLGTSSVPFDTINGNVMVATSLVVEACDSTTTGQVLSNTGGGVACWTDPCCTLDESYDSGGAGAGREIDAVDGAVKISGEDGLLITGSFGSGAVSEWSGSGTTMFFNPNKAAFRSGTAIGTPWDNSNLGDYSFAAGTTTKATNVASTAFGRSSESTGESSFSVGEYVISKSYAEATVGMHNTDYTPTETTAWHWNDRIFSVGNGEGAISKSNALTILKNGNTGLGTDTPDTTLHLVGKLKYVDGNEADGYVLTSDASGNATWAQTDAGTGYASYTDNSYTSGSPFVITAGDTVKIPFFWESAVTAQLPTGVDSLFSRADTTLIGFNGDAYTVRVSFTAQSSSVIGYGVLLFDIGNGTPIVVSERVFTFPKGSATDHVFSFTTSLFAGSTFESNGCQVKLIAGTGNISMHSFNYFITRTHKAK